jgi:hypothetical protein
MSGGSSFSASLPTARARPDDANPMTTPAPTSRRSSVMAPQPPHRSTNTFDGAGDTLRLQTPARCRLDTRPAVNERLAWNRGRGA